MLARLLLCTSKSVSRAGGEQDRGREAANSSLCVRLWVRGQRLNKWEPASTANGRSEGSAMLRLAASRAPPRDASLKHPRNTQFTCSRYRMKQSNRGGRYNRNGLGLMQKIRAHAHSVASWTAAWAIDTRKIQASLLLPDRCRFRSAAGHCMTTGRHQLLAGCEEAAPPCARRRRHSALCARQCARLQARTLPQPPHLRSPWVFVQPSAAQTGVGSWPTARSASGAISLQAYGGELQQSVTEQIES